MAIAGDLARIAFLSNKGTTILRASQVNQITVDEADAGGETLIVLTPAQKAQIRDRLDPLIVEIKTLAAGLP